MQRTSRLRLPQPPPALPALMLSVLILSACGPMELTSVVDTQYLMGNRDLPLQNVLVVYDSRDLALKDRFETAFMKFLEENTDAKAFRDIALYSPLKKLSDKEKLWALKDQSIDGVLYISGGGSGRSIREWLYPEAEIDTGTTAWQSGTAKLFLPKSGGVIWIGSIPGTQGSAGEDLESRRFYSAVTNDLLQQGILQKQRPRNPALPGFNR